jgi:hypothetical protein
MLFPTFLSFTVLVLPKQQYVSVLFRTLPSFTVSGALRPKVTFTLPSLDLHRIFPKCGPNVL